MVTIRKSGPADGPRVLQIWRDAVTATHHFLQPRDRAAIEHEVEQFLPGADLWLAVDRADEPLGFMSLEHGHLEALFVHPHSTGHGVGRTLVEHACGLHSAITTDVNEQNAEAIGFYERLGFVPIGRSDLDGQGRPYPLIHLRRPPR
jgi:putative acetyltransferase